MSEREQAARKRCYGEPKFILYQVGRKAHKKASESAWRALKEGWHGSGRPTWRPQPRPEED
jgi:hypothetical protein